MKEILKKENELFHFEKKNKKRPLSSKNKISIENIENPIVEKNINKSQEKFVRKFAKYKIEKKMNNLEEENLNNFRYSRRRRQYSMMIRHKKRNYLNTGNENDYFLKRPKDSEERKKKIM